MTSRYSKARVLVADDDPQTIAQVRRLLHAEFEVIGTAADGEQALAAAVRLEPDIIVLDVSMPVVNGIETARRYHRSNGHAAVVFLSNHVEPEIVEAAMDTGAAAFIEKPRAAEDLVPALRSAAARNRLHAPAASQL